MVACGDKELSADIAQESLAKAYAQWSKVNSLENPPAWVKKVAINALRDEFRKRAKRKTITSTETVELSTLETLEKCMPTPYAVDFAHTLSTLPDQQRIAATLYYVDDSSVKDIASYMKISQGAVKAHLHNARKNLSESIAVTID